MQHRAQHRAARRRYTLTALAAVTTTVAALAVVGSSPASAAPTSNGRLQVCVSSARTQAASYTVHRYRWTKSFTMRSRAGHVVCSRALYVRQGGYRVTQHTPQGMRVVSVSVSPAARTLSRNVAGAWATASVRARYLTRVGFGNRVIAAPAPKPVPAPKPAPVPAPSDPGTGYIEVCKQAGDGFVTGNVTINVTDSAGASASQVVPVGQCTGPMQVATGTATVSETVPAPYGLAAVKTSPTSALLSTDLANNSAQVNVAASTDGSTETLVTLVNATHLAMFKVCKTLEANAQDLINSGNNAFTFDVSYTALNSAPYSTKVNVIVPTLGQAACVLYPTALPLGTKVTVTEEHAPATTLTGLSVLPASQDAGSSGYTAVFTLGPNANGITSAMFTNRADGTIEICKNASYDGWKFQFVVNGGSPITVLSGQCSRPITVPAGTATVQELPAQYFNLVGFTATGPDGSSRLLSGTNPITVAVPAGGVGNETLVIATNRVQTAQVKICKMLDNNVPVGKTYTFTTVYTIAGQNYTATTKLTPTADGPDGEVCSYLSGSLPVIDANGNLSTFKTTEGPSPFGLTADGKLIVEPTAITYDGGGTAGPTHVWQAGDPGSADGTYYGSATVGQGVNVLTFTNSLVLDP